MVMSLLLLLKILFITLFVFILKDFCLVSISVVSILFLKYFHVKKINCWRYSNNLKSIRKKLGRVRERELIGNFTLRYFVRFNTRNIEKRVYKKLKNYFLFNISCKLNSTSSGISFMPRLWAFGVINPSSAASV